MRRTEVEMLRKMGSRADISSEADKSNVEEDQEGALLLSKDKTLKVVKGLMCLLLSMDFTCNVDLFLITCKVWGIFINCGLGNKQGHVCYSFSNVYVLD